MARPYSAARVIVGPQQTRKCDCVAPRCFSDDDGRCSRCGYQRVKPRRCESTRDVADMIARVIKRP